MSEVYIGIKFSVSLIEKRSLDYEEIDELIKWCEEFEKLGLAPPYDGGSAGNLSFRTNKGFVITAARTGLGSIKRDDFVEVVFCDKDKKQIVAIGLRDPSSETMLHSEIYKTRKEINAIFHGHDEVVMRNLDKLQIPVTSVDRPYGTSELVDDVMEILDDNNYIFMNNHGFVSLGKTMKEAGESAVEINRNARKF